MLTMKQMGELFLEDSRRGRLGKKPLKNNTLSAYRGFFFNWVLPFMGDVLLPDIDEEKMEDLLDYLIVGLKARRSAQQAFNLTKGMLRYAKRKGQIEVVPGIDLHVEVSSLDRAEIEILSMTDMAKVRALALQNTMLKNPIEAGKWRKFYPIFLLLSQTGMGISECSALQWDAITNDSTVVHIKRVLEKPGEGLTIAQRLGVPKTRRARRKLYLTEELALLLQDLRERKASKWVFPDEKNKAEPISYHRVRREMWGELQVQCDVFRSDGKTFGLHSLRHTYASILIRDGQLGSLTKLLGHSTAAFTIDTYGHLIDDGGDLMKQINESVVSAYEAR